MMIIFMMIMISSSVYNIDSEDLSFVEKKKKKIENTEIIENFIYKVALR